MRVGVISDVHGNRVALEAVLEDMPSVDRLVCAGDVVGYNPWHAECVAAIRGEGETGLSDEAEAMLPDDGVPTVMGNHDRAVAFDQAYGFNDMAAAAVDHARETCSADQLEWLGDRPEQRLVCDDRMLVVHGHPQDPDRYTYPEEYAADMLGDEAVLVMGHTHVQGHEAFDDGLVMNPGSVGQPRDGDPRAAYTVVDFDSRETEARRVAYDVDKVVDAVREADLPLRIGTRLRSGQ
ncbi:metallophosphoesterase [Halobacteriales archaeon QH_8_67_27]|nr:MAG: metallophosphoesterase [Halobacteriales archaeon QH_8_67_27]